MKILEPDDDPLLIIVNKREHQMVVCNETESQLEILIEPLPDLPKKEEP